MDWYSWLLKTSLDPSLVAEYAHLFSRNELEASDIPHFDHAFLHSMGISIAKHRLEILKLSKSNSSVYRLFAVMRKTKTYIGRCIRSLASRPDSSAIIILPRRRWAGAAMKRSTRVVVFKERVLMLTGRPSPSPSPVSHSASPMVYNFHKSGGEDDGFRKGVDAEEIRWDSMFKGMKPT